MGKINMTKLKEFLKPDWRKIVIFVVLIILTFGSKIISDAYPELCVLYEVGGIVCDVLFLPVVFVDNNVHYLISGGLSEVLEFLSSWKYIRLIVGGVWLYLLSCLIFWIYDKVKKK